MDAFFTIEHEAHDEFTVQKSRFIGYACPCETEQDALCFLQKVRESHRGASHHCYAYVIGQNRGIMRYSDDGEPGGTAGLPMMDVIRNTEVVNCCVVVVRYFGGILLGTGGLVRAYTQGCKIALNAAGIIRMEWSASTLCEVPYSCWDSVQYAIRHLPALISDISYGAQVSFTLATRVNQQEEVFEALQKATSRQLEMLPDHEGYRSWPVS